MKCKYCGDDTALSAQESAAIQADLDARYTRDEQAALELTIICPRCVPKHSTRLAQAAAAGELRLKRIRGSRTRSTVKHVPNRWRGGAMH